MVMLCDFVGDLVYCSFYWMTFDYDFYDLHIRFFYECQLIRVFEQRKQPSEPLVLMRSHEILSFSDEILRFPDIAAHFSPTWRMAPLKIGKTWPKVRKSTVTSNGYEIYQR